MDSYVVQKVICVIIDNRNTRKSHKLHQFIQLLIRVLIVKSDRYVSDDMYRMI